MVKVVKYIILFEDDVKNYAYNFYETEEIAKKQMLQLSPTQGKIAKVTVEFE